MNRLIRVKQSNRAQPVRLMKQLLAVLSAPFVAVMLVASFERFVASFERFVA